jgi:hypothetical protein
MLCVARSELDFRQISIIKMIVFMISHFFTIEP